jgi:hypothetical protein
MREQIKDWVGYVARIEIALELERIFGIEITDAELERIEVPSDFVTLVSALAPAIAHHQAAAQVLSALTRARREKTDAAELNQTFTELFSAHEDG